MELCNLLTHFIHFDLSSLFPSSLFSFSDPFELKFQPPLVDRLFFWKQRDPCLAWACLIAANFVHGFSRSSFLPTFTLTYDYIPQATNQPST
jgi:hypothetical protein